MNRLLLSTLSVAALVAAGAALAHVPANAPQNDRAGETVEQATLRMYNAERAAQTPPAQALVWDAGLAAASQAWVDSHVNLADGAAAMAHDPNGGEEHVSMAESGPGGTVAPSVQDTLRGLIDSPSHGQGVIRANVRRVGCATGTAQVNNKARRLTVCRYQSEGAPAAQPAAATTTAAPQAVAATATSADLLSIVNTRRASAGLPALTWSADLAADAVDGLAREIDSSRPEPTFRVQGARAPGMNGNAGHTPATLLQIMADNGDAALIAADVTQVGCATALTVSGGQSNRYLRCRYK